MTRVRRPRIVPAVAALTVLAVAVSASRRVHGQSAPARPAIRTAQVIVYGGTAAGVIAAVAAAREGARVLLLEPRDHLGGMVSGGLGRTDVGRPEVIGGYAREFFERVGKNYGKPLEWYVEPHVAEEVFRNLAREAGVEVLYRHRLRERNVGGPAASEDLLARPPAVEHLPPTSGLTRQQGRITAITTEHDVTFSAPVFIDATYEGDLMAQAGVTYMWGREARDQYGESLAGVRDRTPKHQFAVRLRPFDENGNWLPEVSRERKAPVGSADRKVQAYNFRLCMTRVPENRVLFPKPPRYDPERYELLARMLAEMDKVKSAWSVDDVMNPGPIPNGKMDMNNNGAFSTDYIGGSYDYPDGDYATRARIWQAHVDYVQGFLYFLQNDSRVPKALHDQISSSGLCADEFTDTGHWPHQLYIREARRMIGEYVMSQKDIQTDLTKLDAVGMGSYNSDSHNMQRIVNDEGFVENEGDMQVPVTPYQIPYRVMLPKSSEITNLLVPVCVSATHVAYSTLRMEPQYMIMGHAAGVAAAMAAERGLPVQQIDLGVLTARLRAQHAVLSWPQ